MTTLLRRLAPAAVSCLLCACGSVSVLERNGARASSLSQGLGEVPPLDLVACIDKDPAQAVDDIFFRFQTGPLSRIFSPAARPLAPDCDVRILVGRWKWTVLAARSGERLFTVVGKPGAGSNLSSWMPRAVHQRLRSGTELHSLAVAGRGAAVAAAPSPSAPVQTAPPAPPPSDVDAPSYALPEREHDLAVVVGVETYSDLPKAPYAERDAAAFAAHARALGVPPRNVVLLTGSKAGRAAVEKYVEQWLPRLATPESRVYFYFSGHGAPDVKTGQAYLVPWDGDPNFLETTAYPVKRLYEKLEALRAKQVLVAMDSCFSGAGGRSVLASGARPLVVSVETGAPKAGLTALTASAGAEISGSLDDKAHGAFTYFLLKGLNGGSKDLSASGLLRYLTPLVQNEARRLNRDQTPQLLGDAAVSFRP